MKAVRRHAGIFFGTWLAWLALAQSLALTQIVLGAVLGAAVAALWQRLDPPVVHIRHPIICARLVFRVASDLIKSNFAVARIVLLNRPHQPGVIRVPLQLTAPWGLAALACIITATPGTIWVRHDATQRLLVIHVLDLHEPATAIAHIQQRYAKPLKEIFQ